MPALPPPPLRLPGSRSPSPHEGPAFGIPSYSQRGLPRPKVSRPTITAVTFQSDPAIDIIKPRTLPADDNEDDLVEIATARVTTRRSLHPPSEKDSSTSLPVSATSASVPRRISLRRTASISSDHSSLQSLPPSISDTFVAIPQPIETIRAPSLAPSASTLSLSGHSSINSSTQGWRSGNHRSAVSLPLQMQGVAPASMVKTTLPVSREVLGEGPGGRLETEADKFKRLYLCPWDATSPRTYKLGQQTLPQHSLSLSSSPPEKSEAVAGGDPPFWTPSRSRPTRPPFDKKRFVLSLIGGLLLLFLAIDLFLLNIKVLPAVFGHTTALQRDAQTCLSLFAISAPSNPVAFPCSTCAPTISTLSPSASRPADQTRLLQFCALKDLFVSVEATIASNATLSATHESLTSLGWMNSTDFCTAWGGVSCGSDGKVERVVMVEPLVPGQLDESVKWLGESVKAFTVAGVSIAL